MRYTISIAFHALAMPNAVKIGTLAKVLSGLPTSPSRHTGMSLVVPCVQPWQLLATGVSRDYGEMIRAVPVDEDSYLRPGDVLLRRVNPNGAAVFADDAAKVLPSVNVLVVRPVGRVESDWFAFIFSASPLLSRLRKRSGIGTTVTALTPRELSQAAIPVPEESTRRALVGAWRASRRMSAALQDLLGEQEKIQSALGLAALCGDAAFSRMCREPSTERGQKAASPPADRIPFLTRNNQP